MRPHSVWNSTLVKKLLLNKKTHSFASNKCVSQAWNQALWTTKHELWKIVRLTRFQKTTNAIRFNLLQSLPIRDFLYFLLFLCYSHVLRGRISVSLSLAAVHNVWVLINFLTQLLASVSSKSQPITPRIIIGDAIVFSALISWYSIAGVQE